LKNIELADGLDEAQKILISIVQQVLKFNVLNVWQYDSTPIVKLAKNVVCPANGFLAEIIAFNSGANSITFYDKNPNNIAFKKYLYNNWDGLDYDNFANKWAVEQELSIEPSFDIDKQKSKQPIIDVSLTIFSDWNKWKDTVSVNFINCDLIKDIDIILSYVSENSIIHTSTILTIYPFSAIVYDQTEINMTRERIASTNAQWIET
jgi:hypothetical protein